MQIRIGYELLYNCPQPTPMALMLTVRHTRAADLVVPDRLFTEPLVPDPWATATGSAIGAVGSWRPNCRTVDTA
jgi:hypothetical protein